MATKISGSVLLLLLLLAVAASPAAAATMAGDDDEARGLLSSGKLNFAEWLKKAVDATEEVVQWKYDEKRKERERGVGFQGWLPSGGGSFVAVVKAGSMGFSVRDVDVTSEVTVTSQCGGSDDAGSRPVPCDNPLCEQYKCGGGGAEVCSNGAGQDADDLQLRQGTVSVSTFRGRQIFSNNTVYTCSASSSKDAVVGLGRRSVLAASFRRFAYFIDGDLRSFVWLGDASAEDQAAPAQGGGRKSTTTPLIPFGVDKAPNIDPNLYFIAITGIKVGSGDVVNDKAAGIMTTKTIPFTLLNPVLFDHLKKKLPTAAADKNSSVLCYTKDTELPAITLVFAGKDAAMKLEPEHYSYKKSDGVMCLSILRSPLRGGVSIIGSMLQVGRKMTYDLDENTLTFDFEALSSSMRSSLPSPSASRSSAAVALTPAVFLSAAWMLLLLAVMM